MLAGTQYLGLIKLFDL